MTDEELRAKFEENAGGFLSAASCDQVADRIQRLEALPDAKVLVELSTNEEYRKKT
jgi:hypothetical protein